jgi:predicted phosphodiesterase
MRVAIMSDSHDNIWNLRKAVEMVNHRGECRLVCFGHTHEHEVKRAGNVTLLNPGEIMGKEGSPGFCFVDTETSEIQRVEL